MLESEKLLSCPKCGGKAIEIVEELSQSDQWLCRNCGTKWQQPTALRTKSKSWADLMGRILIRMGVFALVLLLLFYELRGVLGFGTAKVQQVRETKGVTRIWMNDGTVWEVPHSDATSGALTPIPAALLADGDEVRYESVPFAPKGGFAYDPAAPTQNIEACYFVDKSRPGLERFPAFRIVGDPKRESCPDR